MHDIFGNMEESEFGLEYLFRVDRRLRANTSKRLYHTPPIFKGILKPKPHLQGDILTPTLLQWGLVPISNLLKLINFITVHKKKHATYFFFLKISFDFLFNGEKKPSFISGFVHYAKRFYIFVYSMFWKRNVTISA